MTLLHTQHEFGRVVTRGPRSGLVKRAFVQQLDRLARTAGAGAGACFRLAHFAIVAAKLRRLRLERMTRREVDEFRPVPRPDDQRRQPGRAADIPQRPLILDDRWDF